MQKALIFAAPLALVFAASAYADEFADSAIDINRVETGTAADGGTPLSTSADDGDLGTDALGAPDWTAPTNANQISALGFDEAGTVDTSDDVGGDIELGFTDNACLDGPGDDLHVYDASGLQSVNGNESALVEVGTGGALTNIGTVGPGDFTLDLDGTGVAGFNRIKLTATDWAGQTTLAGLDLDAVECLNSLDQADIVKESLDETILVGTGTEQNFSFTIEITNDIGDNAFEGLTFFDSVPAEFDLDEEGEDEADGTDDGACADGDNCDGIIVTGDCTVEHDVPQGAKNKNQDKLEPEHLSIDASALLETDFCTIKVFVKTDTKDFPRGKSPGYTPTSCPLSEEITLNDGVRVFDESMNLLLHDDDSLVLQCS